jgi:hypothetical protein
MSMLSRFVGVFFVIFSLNGMSSVSFGQGADFEKFKSQRLAEIDARIQKMQEHRSCISSATSHTALRSCGEKMRTWHKEEREERREKRDERRERREERQGNL